MVRLPIIDEEALVYLERLHYERDGWLVALQRCASSVDVIPERRREICAQYQEANLEYQVLFRELIEQYAPQYTDGCHEFRVNFLRGELMVEEVAPCKSGA